MSQFYWRLKNDVKDLLLALPDPQTFNEVISQTVRCDNRLFQHRQNQRPRHHLTMTARSLDPHLDAEDI